MMDRIQYYNGLAVHNNHDLKSVQNAVCVIKDNNLTLDEQHKICRIVLIAGANIGLIPFMV